jgi:hypothetical protein
MSLGRLLHSSLNAVCIIMTSDIIITPMSIVLFYWLHYAHIMRVSFCLPHRILKLQCEESRRLVLPRTYDYEEVIYSHVFVCFSTVLFHYKELKVSYRMNVVATLPRARILPQQKTYKLFKVGFPPPQGNVGILPKMKQNYTHSLL